MLAQRLSEADEISLREEELAAERTALIGRLTALALIVPLVTLLTPWPGPVFVYLLLAAFAATGWLSWLVAKSDWGRPWHQYAFVTVDFALLTFTLLYPNPLFPLDYPPQFAFRFGNAVYFFVLLAGLSYAYRPGLVMWGGISAAFCWGIGVFWMTLLPGSTTWGDRAVTPESVLEAFGSPGFIDIGVRVQEAAVFMICAWLLALAVSRSRAIALRQAKLASERANLARYFPRKTADLLAGRSNPFSEPREHNAAVLFADLVSFTKWAEEQSPRQSIESLRDIHGLATKAVFDAGGTLDKFLGDGLMATFGTPEPGKDDATRALSAMVAMADAFDEWKRTQAKPEEAQLNLSIGLHYGPVVIGDIGTAERLEFAVLGDTVNVASRLEGATRQAGCKCLVSADLIKAVRAEGSGTASGLLNRLSKADAIPLRGKSRKTGAYKL